MAWMKPLVMSNVLVSILMFPASPLAPVTEVVMVARSSINRPLPEMSMEPPLPSSAVVVMAVVGLIANLSVNFTAMLLAATLPVDSVVILPLLLRKMLGALTDSVVAARVEGAATVASLRMAISP